MFPAPSRCPTPGAGLNDRNDPEDLQSTIRRFKSPARVWSAARNERTVSLYAHAPASRHVRPFILGPSRGDCPPRSVGDDVRYGGHRMRLDDTFYRSGESSQFSCRAARVAMGIKCAFRPGAGDVCEGRGARPRMRKCAGASRRVSKCMDAVSWSWCVTPTWTFAFALTRLTADVEQLQFGPCGRVILDASRRRESGPRARNQSRRKEGGRARPSHINASVCLSPARARAESLAVPGPCPRKPTPPFLPTPPLLPSGLPQDAAISAKTHVHVHLREPAVPARPAVRHARPGSDSSASTGPLEHRAVRLRARALYALAARIPSATSDKLWRPTGS
ncbi:hypothetical protein DAEQUDRAFT_480498 [Daedalea quercina L-15889]|uniref:Uncharacterized protein n=1 Tax=Daedalea quercina L-15889 TaxID=1314783 RepID=A0A165MTU0_9APHY|nr:hypothetical protein DAEQUDRAFT_480498 [Daedalea quercina L-15889]